MIGKNCLVTFVLALLSTAVTYAQEQEEPFRYTFSAVSWDATISDLSFKSADKVNEIYIPNGGLSKPHTYVGNNPMVFFTSSTNEVGEKVIVPKAMVNIPERKTKKWMLIFVERSTASGLEYSVLPIPDDGSSSQSDAYIIYNYCSYPVAIQIDKERVMLPPVESAVIKAESDDDQNVTIQMASNARSGKWEIVYQSRWDEPNGRKFWVFLTDGPNDRPFIKKMVTRE